MNKKPEIIALIRQFYRVQEHRIAFGGQIRALKEQKLNVDPIKKYFDQLFEIEKQMGKDIGSTIKEEEIWKEFLKGVKGIGPLISAGLINLIDIKEAKHISSLWKFAGMDVTDEGKAPKRKKKVKSTWNPLMRMLCWKIGQSFLRTGSPYRRYYDRRKEKELKRKYQEGELAEKYKRSCYKKEDIYLIKGHAHNRATRVMVKRFLADLWIAWRQIEGLEVSQAYVIDRLGHKPEK